MHTSIRFKHSNERKEALSHRRQSLKLKNLITNYFIQEGYKQAALSLVREAERDRNTGRIQDELRQKRGSEDASMEIDSKVTSQAITLPGFSSIDKRKEIKYLILKGDILKAVRTISAYYPTVLDDDKLLLFKLLRLNLIEMIREHKFGKTSKTEEDERKFLDSVLKFVRENLINKITGSTELLSDLEITMSLLCFDFDPAKPADQMLELPEKSRRLFDLSLRNECYRSVNQAILDSENNGLAKSALQRIRYKGIPFVDYDSAMLDLLPDPEPLSQVYPAFNTEAIPGFDDVSKESTRESLEGMIAFASSSEQPIGGVSPAAAKSSDSLKLYRLEEICRMWVATESMLTSKGTSETKSSPEDLRMQL